MTDWDDYRAFLQVARLGSFAAATKTLGMVQATIRRHVETLEARMGALLFLRNGASLTLTAVGEDLFHIIETMEGAAINAGRMATGPIDELHGRIAIVIAPRMSLLLPKALRILRESLPRTEFHVEESIGLAPLFRGAADIAVVLGLIEPVNLTLSHAGMVEIGVYGRRATFGDDGLPTTMAEVARLPLIGPSDEAALSYLAGFVGVPRESVTIAVRSNSGLTQLAMIRAGLGVGHWLCVDADKDPDLVRAPIVGGASWLPVTVVSSMSHPEFARVDQARELLAAALRDVIDRAGEERSA